MMRWDEEQDQNKTPDEKLDKVLKIIGMTREDAEKSMENKVTELLVTIAMVVHTKPGQDFPTTMRAAQSWAVEKTKEYEGLNLTGHEGMRRYIKAAADEIRRQENE